MTTLIGVRDDDSGHVHTGFTSFEEAEDWADPTKGNPNPGSWTVVWCDVTPWRPYSELNEYRR